MVFPPERSELLAALVALFGFVVGHPELAQISVFVVGQLVVALQCEQARENTRGRASVMLIHVLDRWQLVSRDGEGGCGNSVGIQSGLGGH